MVNLEQKLMIELRHSGILFGRDIHDLEQSNIIYPHIKKAKNRNDKKIIKDLQI